MVSSKGIPIEYVAKGRGIKEKARTDAIQLPLHRHWLAGAGVEGKAQFTTCHGIVEV